MRRFEGIVYLNSAKINGVIHLQSVRYEQEEALRLLTMRTRDSFTYEVTSPTGLEPAQNLAPEASALSTELRGLHHDYTIKVNPLSYLSPGD